LNVVGLDSVGRAAYGAPAAVVASFFRLKFACPALLPCGRHARQ
jgi:hypothetical protein